MLAFVVAQLVLPFLEGEPERLASAMGLLLLTAGFTGIATTATHPSRSGRLDRANT